MPVTNRSVDSSVEQSTCVGECSGQPRCCRQCGARCQLDRRRLSQRLRLMFWDISWQAGFSDWNISRESQGRAPSSTVLDNGSTFMLARVCGGNSTKVLAASRGVRHPCHPQTVADVGSPRRKPFCDPREPRYASATQPARLAGWAALHGLNVLRFACRRVYAFARKCPSFTARLAHRPSKLIRCWADFTKGPRLRRPSFGRQRGPIWLTGRSTTNRKLLLQVTPIVLQKRDRTRTWSS